MASIDYERFYEALLRLDWHAQLEDLDRHALVVTSPSGLRWRIVAELIPPESPL